MKTTINDETGALKEWIYPAKLDEVLVSINKIESEFNLRPQQLEKVIQFQNRYHLMEDEHPALKR